MKTLILAALALAYGYSLGWLDSARHPQVEKQSVVVWHDSCSDSADDDEDPPEHYLTTVVRK